jgi:hypothetical protein
MVSFACNSNDRITIGVIPSLSKINASMAASPPVAEIVYQISGLTDCHAEVLALFHERFLKIAPSSNGLALPFVDCSEDTLSRISKAYASLINTASDKRAKRSLTVGKVDEFNHSSTNSLLDGLNEAVLCAAVALDEAATFCGGFIDSYRAACMALKTPERDDIIDRIKQVYHAVGINELNLDDYPDINGWVIYRIPQAL